MKTFKIYFATAAILFSLFNFSPPETKAQVAVSFQVFYNDLAPYGTWVSYSHYGYAWAPRIAVGFRPYYSGGHWAYTDEGWLWVSDYPWGWAPYHYGSWVMDPVYGWLWVPGYDWAPAWVSWGYYDGYYGWAPCEPGFSFSIGYRPPINYWVFAQPRYMVSGEMVRYSYPANNQRIAIGSNTITNVQRISTVDNTNQRGGRTYFAGPPRQDFEKNAKTTVQPVSVRESAKPGKTELSGNAVSVYRPQVQKMEDARPAKVGKVEDLKPQAGSKNTQQGKPATVSGKSNPQINGRNNSKTQTAPASAKQAPAKPQVHPSGPKQNPQIIQRPKESPQQKSVTPVAKPKQKQIQPQKQQPSREVAPKQPQQQPQQPRDAAPSKPQQPRQMRQQRSRPMAAPRQANPPREMNPQQHAAPMPPQGPQEENGRKK